MKASLSIKEIKTKLAEVRTEDDPLLKELKDDPRKGAQQLYRTWVKQADKQKKLAALFETMRKYEMEIWDQGYRFIGGIDEVGRGPLAGPVVSACVILPATFYLPGLTDSKMLSKDKREEYFHRIMEEALSVGIGTASAKEIDLHNIYQATKLAMKRAIEAAAVQPDYLLLDAMELASVELPQTSLIKGDSKSISIAASSVIAKVTRDRYMEELAKEHPVYGFERNAGYGTAEHLQALKNYGITSEHRHSFTPVKDVLHPS